MSEADNNRITLEILLANSEKLLEKPFLTKEEKERLDWIMNAIAGTLPKRMMEQNND